MSNEIITVIGAGEMGHAIGLFFAFSGHPVRLFDIQPHILEKAKESIEKKWEVLKRKVRMEKPAGDTLHIVYTDKMEDALRSADLVIEAIPEVLEWKADLFRSITKIIPSHAILASNTSTISMETLSGSVKTPEKFLGLHFFNPAEKMKLVELIPSSHTGTAVMDVARHILENAGKKVLWIRNDRPGFAVNRMIAPTQILTNAILEEKMIPPEAFDAHFEKLPGMPPFELLDYVGLDTAVHTMEYYQKHLDPAFVPGGYLTDKIQKHELGRKTGSGIYRWEKDSPVKRDASPDPDLGIRHVKAIMVNEAYRLLKEGVLVSPGEVDYGLQYGLNNRPLMKGITQEAMQEMIQSLEYLADRFRIEYFRPEKSLTNGIDP